MEIPVVSLNENENRKPLSLPMPNLRSLLSFAQKIISKAVATVVEQRFNNG